MAKNTLRSHGRNYSSDLRILDKHIQFLLDDNLCSYPPKSRRKHLVDASKQLSLIKRTIDAEIRRVKLHYKGLALGAVTNPPKNANQLHSISLRIPHLLKPRHKKELDEMKRSELHSMELDLYQTELLLNSIEFLKIEMDSKIEYEKRQEEAQRSYQKRQEEFSKKFKRHRLPPIPPGLRN